MTDNRKCVHVIGGGTINHVRNHLALCVPSWGETARHLYNLCESDWPELRPVLHLTHLAGGRRELETNDDLKQLLAELVADPLAKVIFMTAGVCDFDGEIGHVQSGKYASRLQTRDGARDMMLTPAEKLLPAIRKTRKDIFLVGCKATCGLRENDQYAAAMRLLKSSSCNLVLANDSLTRCNMIVTPEEARYHVTTNRDEVLRNLVDIAKLRSHLTFTQSTPGPGSLIPWSSELVPPALRMVVNHCIMQGAYKPFRGATVGHFACKLGPQEFLTSIRRSNFNDIAKTGLVRITTDGPDTVIAYGAKPSVGGQSQRIIFNDHPEYDCVLHFHSPRKFGSQVPVVSQREVECGSHQCGQRTSAGLQKFGNLSAVYLDQHGPNIVFHSSINPQEVIDFIEDNFKLEEKTGGYLPPE